MRSSNASQAFRVVALPLVALLGCGGSHDKAAPTPSAASAAPAVPIAPVAPAADEATPVTKARPAPSAAAVRAAAHQPVATVNGAPIEAEKVGSVYRMNKSMLEARGRMLDEADDRALKTQSLEAVIADELLFQAAVAKGTSVGDAAVEASVKQIRARAGSDAAYEKMLAQAGLGDADVRREVERNLRTEAFRKALVAGRAVSDDDAKKYYAANAPKGMFNVPERVHVQYILVKAGEKDPESVRADAKTRAEEAAKRAGAGEDFASLAKQFSQDPTAARGGDIGLIPRGVRFPKFDDVAFSTKPGEVSSVFETPQGFNVIKVLEKKPASVQSYDEIKAPLMAELGRLMEQDIVRAKVQELARTASIVILDRSLAPAEQAAVPPPKP
jgi:peptidyl-prolyl cis-trans isomerase C